MDIKKAVEQILQNSTGLKNPYNFVVQSYSFSLHDLITYLRLPSIRLFKLTKGSIPPIGMTNNEKLIPQGIHSRWEE